MRIGYALCIAGALSTAAVAAYVATREGSRPAKAPSVAPDDEVQADARPPRPMAGPPRVARSSSPGVDEEQPGEIAAESSPQETLPSDAELMAQQEAELDGRIETEGRDPIWASQTEQAARDALSSEALAGNRLLELECRSTLCRAEVSPEGFEAEDRFLEAVPLTQPFATSGFIRQHGDPRSPTVVLFFAREGHNIREEST